MRRRLVWLVTGPLVLAGVESAHALANLLVGSPDGELFDVGASSRGSLPFVAAALAAAVALALTSRAAGLWSSSRAGASVAAPFALLPLFAFAALEIGEAGLHPGGADWGSLATPSVAVGLALQLPFALAGYLLTRLLLRLSDAVAALVQRLAPPVPRHGTQIVVRPVDDVPRRVAPARHTRGRAPPAAVAHSG